MSKLDDKQTRQKTRSYLVLWLGLKTHKFNLKRLAQEDRKGLQFTSFKCQSYIA